MALLNTRPDSASIGLIGYCQAAHWSMIYKYIFMTVTSLAGDQTALRPSFAQRSFNLGSVTCSK